MKGRKEGKSEKKVSCSCCLCIHITGYYLQANCSPASGYYETKEFGYPDNQGLLRSERCGRGSRGEKFRPQYYR